ncbi:MAG: hypothetical protein C5B57_12130 [Blastocatellia bacterium]|nr:MAG: hypothetical protein C5B57_12130 [Blastocatellia bacterium]
MSFGVRLDDQLCRFWIFLFRQALLRRRRNVQVKVTGICLPVPGAGYRLRDFSGLSALSAIPNVPDKFSALIDRLVPAHQGPSAHLDFK